MMACAQCTYTGFPIFDLGLSFYTAGLQNYLKMVKTHATVVPLQHQPSNASQLVCLTVVIITVIHLINKETSHGL